MTCQCHNGLGFDIDWGGIVGGAIKAYGTLQQSRSAIALQRAQQAAALRAQEAELQLMQRRQAMTVAQPVGSGGYPQVYAAPRRSELPSWVIPAASGVGVLLLVRR